MNKLLFPFLVSILIFISSCNHSENTKQCVAGMENTTTYRDEEGDAAFPIIDMGKLSVAINNCEIKTKVSLLSAPLNLTYNSSDVSENVLEYQWGVRFDIDGDGTAANDIQLAISHFKPPGSAEAQGNVPDFTQSSLWLISGNGHSGTYAGTLSTSLSGSVLTLIVNIDENSALLRITNETPVKFETHYESSGAAYTDIYPETGYAN